METRNGGEPEQADLTKETLSLEINNEPAKPLISFTFTMFNIMCSSIGIGVLFLPSTLCGAGLVTGIIGILVIGLAADWSSRALIEVTCKSKAKSLEEMFCVVLGEWASHTYSISVFLLLIGALSIFTLLMGSFANDVIVAIIDHDKDYYIHWRLMSLIFSVLCGSLLILRNLKVLSYVSVVKIFVMVFILIIATIYYPNEYSIRRALPNHGIGTFVHEFPLSPTIFGVMKAMGSWQTAYLFHMGVSDMYFSMKNRSYSRWSKVSILSVLLIALLNVCFGVIGYLATADQLIPTAHIKDLCSSSKVFLALYQSNGLVMTCRILIVFVLVASYPLIFYFLKEYSLIILKNLFSKFYQTKSYNWWNNTATVGIWVLILGCSVAMESPFAVTDLVVSCVGTIAVFLMPVLCWIEMNGGFVYVFSLGLIKQNNNNTNKGTKNMMNVHIDGNIDTDTAVRQSRVISGSSIGNENNQTDNEHIVHCQPSIISMISAQCVFWLSVCFILMGLTVSIIGFLPNANIGWRSNYIEWTTNK